MTWETRKRIREEYNWSLTDLKDRLKTNAIFLKSKLSFTREDEQVN